jgi:hypothetical protein
MDYVVKYVKLLCNSEWDGLDFDHTAVETCWKDMDTVRNAVIDDTGDYEKAWDEAMKLWDAFSQASHLWVATGPFYDWKYVMQKREKKFATLNESGALPRLSSRERRPLAP